MTANFLRIRCPTRSTDRDKTPYQLWTGKKPLLASFKAFSCHAYVHVPKPKRSKLDAISVHCRFIGYSDHEKSYRFEEIRSRLVLVSRDAQFMGHLFDSGRRDYVPDEAVLEDEQLTEEEYSHSNNTDTGSEDTTQDSNDATGGKRSHRTQSLEALANPPQAKRPTPYLTMAEMSATAHDSSEVETPYIVIQWEKFRQRSSEQ